MNRIIKLNPASIEQVAVTLKGKIEFDIALN